jgi:hypothetical protein
MDARVRRRRRLYPLLGVCAVLMLLVLAAGGKGQQGGRIVSKAAASATPLDPLVYRPARRAQFEQRAAAGFAHALLAPGQDAVLAIARQVAGWRPAVEEAARSAGVQADALEAVVFVQSVERLGSGSLRGLSEGALRARIERFDPLAGLAATARALSAARERLGREDLAIAATEMGVDRVERALDAYGRRGIPYAQLYFDSSPARHPEAWAIIAPLGDESGEYLWRVLAARDIMARFRDDPAALARIADLQDNKASAEEVLHPPDTTPRFRTPAAVAAARENGALMALPVNVLQAYGVVVDEQMGQLAPGLDQPAALYRALRPEALAVLAYVGAGTRQIGHASGPIAITSTVRDDAYQHLLSGSTAEATRNYSLHTTGFAFDVLRRYETPEQGLAFEFMLGRLTALDIVAWVREAAAIHVTVGPRGRELLPLLRYAMAQSGAGATGPG